MALVNAFGAIALDASVQEVVTAVEALSTAQPLPTGASTATKQDELLALQQEVRNLADSVNTLVAFLYANTPRRDAANRLAVNGSEVTQPVSGTVTATVASTVVSNMTNISGQPNQYMGQGVPLHVYDNVKVT